MKIAILNYWIGLGSLKIWDLVLGQRTQWKVGLALNKCPFSSSLVLCSCWPNKGPKQRAVCTGHLRLCGRKGSGRILLDVGITWQPRISTLLKNWQCSSLLSHDIRHLWLVVKALCNLEVLESAHAALQGPHAEVNAATLQKQPYISIWLSVSSRQNFCFNQASFTSLVHALSLPLLTLSSFPCTHYLYLPLTKSLSTSKACSAWRNLKIVIVLLWCFA